MNQEDSLQQTDSTEEDVTLPEGEDGQVKLPENPLYEVDVHMDTATLYDYMLRHTYTSPMGLVATLLGCMGIVFFAGGAGVLYLIMGIVVLAYLPWNLFISARKQAITNDAFKKPLHYSFTDEGVYVSQGETVQMQAWKDMYKAISTGRSIVLYTSRVNASVFPRRDLGEDTALLIQLIATHMPPGKVRIRR